MIVRVDTPQITGWDSFHRVFAEAFGFPRFYGCNMDAWIDCMSSLDAPEDGMTTVHVTPGDVVTILLEEAAEFAGRCPEQYEAVVECSAFVNWRRIELGEAPVLALAFHR